MIESVDITRKTRTLLTALSVVYAVLEGNPLFLAPIVTICIPYGFMQSKNSQSYEENKGILNKLFLFNIVTFIGVSTVTNRMNQVILDIVLNIFVSFVYYKIVWSIQIKQDKIHNNPDVIYKKLEDKVLVLEKMKEKLENDKEKTTNDKTISSIEMKLEALNQKILQEKRKLKLIKEKNQSNNIK